MNIYSHKDGIKLLVILFSLVILGVLTFLLPTVDGSYALTQACVSPPPGLVSWWPGDGNANDIRGNNNGTLQGGATFAPGIVSQAFSFDGADDFVNVPDAPSLTLGAAPFTIDLWVKFNLLKGRDPFISHDESTDDRNKWIFWYDDRGHGIGGPALRFHVNGPTIGAVDPIIAPWNPNVGQWYHVAVTRDGSLYALYIDGVQVATATNSLTIPDPSASLMIGGAETIFFNGLIDEVDIFNRALSASEIQAIYNAGSAGKCKSQPPPPTPPPTPCSRIAFDSTRDGNYEIYVMNADGMGQTNLTNNTANDVRAAFSRDGSKIAFGSNRDGNYEIYVMNADGMNQRRLTNNSEDDYIPNFSPDGSKIVFESTRNGSKDHEEIYVMNADGTGQTRLTNNPARDGNPAFSPDGSKIVFESNRDGNLEIYVMNTDGTNPTRLTINSADDGDPIFSPDGSKIAFETNRDNEYWEIYVMNADGSGPTRLTNNMANDTDPFFSPDGSKIAFETNRNDGQYEIYVMSVDGAGQENRTNNLANDFSPSWTGCNANRPPSFFPPTIITRLNGAPAKRSVIARVRDTETPAGNLTVTVFNAPSFISVTNLTNDNGSVSADVAVNCAPTPGSFFVSLRVTDGGGLTGFGTFRMTVTEATLSYSSPIPISFNSARAVMPDTLPEGFTSFAVSAPNFGGSLSVDQATGVVRISRARPTGNYTVTVAATNLCGVTLTRSFTLIVANGNTEYQGVLGEPIPSNAPEQGSKGSILLFNLYTSSGGSENTRITLTNRHPTLSAALRLFFVTNDGSAADISRCLLADSSTSFLTSEIDPGDRGFLIVLAINAATGSPMSFNYLTGKEDILLASGHSATDVKAETFQALFPEGSSLPIVENTATINFDDISYSRAARTLSLEDVPNPANGNNTILVFNRIGGNLNSRLSPIGGFRGILYEKSAPEIFHSFSASATQTQFFSTLSDAFPLTMPSFTQLLSGGKGWRMVFQALSDLGLTGLALNRGPVKLNKNLLTPLALTPTASLTVPAYPVFIGCP